MANDAKLLTALTLAGGINTAYTAPAGTAIMINSVTITNNISGTASAYNVVVSVASGAVVKTWLPITAITAGDGMQFNGAFTLPVSGLVLMSASSGSALDVLMAGLEMT